VYQFTDFKIRKETTVKHIFLSTLMAFCGILFATDSTFAGNNVAVELSEEGVLTIVGEQLLQGQPLSHPSVFVTVENGWVTVEGAFDATLNEQDADLPFSESEVTAISASDLSTFRLEIFEHLCADVSVDAQRIFMTAPFFENDLSNAGVIGNTRINSGRASVTIYLYGIGFVGDVDITTGLGPEIIQIGRSPIGYVAPVTIQGNLFMDTAQDTGIVEFSFADVFGDVWCDLGQGDDSFAGYGLKVFGNAVLLGGPGSDSYFGDPIVEGALIVFGFED
jgi:hypothetical protein